MVTCANVDAIQEVDVDVICSLMNFFMMAVTVDREYMFVNDFKLIMWLMVLLGQTNLLMV